MMDKYQRLYSISEQRQQFIYQMGRLVDGTWEWNLLWRRDQLESELALASNFMVDVEALGVVGIRSFVGGIYHALHHSVLAL